MGINYILINLTKREYIQFSRLGADKENEIIGNPVTSALTTWYLLKNSGDKIGFIPDKTIDINSDKRTFKNISWEMIKKYIDVTEKTVAELVSKKILKDDGKNIFDENEPDIYIRNIRNIWME